MIRSIRSNWMYLIMLLATIAGVFAPLWLTWLQTPERDIVVHVVSQSALQPPTNNAVSKLKVVLDGQVLTEPYLSVIRISNEGNKPILSKDFEAPLEMQMEKPQSAVQAIVSEKSPKDIQAILDWDSQAIRLKPTLLNPQDSITIEVLSQGGLPTFAFSSRIAGIGAVTVRNASDKKEKPFFLIISFLLAYLLAIPAVAGIWRLATLAVAGLWLTQINAVSITLRGRTIAALIMIGVASVEFVMLRIFDMLKIDSLIYLTISMILLFLAAIPFALMLERPSAVVADK